MIIHELMEEATKRYQGQKVVDLRVGLGYTGVLLEDGSGGIAFSFAGEALWGREFLPNPGKANGMDALEMLGWASSEKPIMAAAGVAAINALISSTISGYEVENGTDILDISSCDRVGMVGYFRPFAQRIREMSKELVIFDRTPGEDTLPDWAEELYLPQCDVVIITGTTIINKTVDRVLSLCQQAKKIILMGPSTVMAPDVFRNYGVTLLAGSRVTDGPGMMTLISQGGAGFQVGDYAEKLTLRLSHPT